MTEHVRGVAVGDAQSSHHALVLIVRLHGIFELARHVLESLLLHLPVIRDGLQLLPQLQSHPVLIFVVGLQLTVVLLESPLLLTN